MTEVEESTARCVTGIAMLVTDAEDELSKVTVNEVAKLASISPTCAVICES